MTVIKYMDRGWIMKANAYAKSKGWKKTIADELLWRIPENKIVPICFMVPEDDVKMTVTLTVHADLKKGKAVNYELHIPLQLWEKLPEIEAPEESADDEEPESGGDSMGHGAKEFLGL